MSLQHPWPGTVGVVPAVVVLMVLSVIDARTHRLPDRIVLPSIAIALVWSAIWAALDGGLQRLLVPLCGAAVYFGVLLLVHLVSPRGMGFGDVKLAALLGVMLGWCTSSTVAAATLVLWALLIGFGSGTAAGLLILIRRRANEPFAFGPFLVLGTLVTMLASGSLSALH